MRIELRPDEEYRNEGIVGWHEKRYPMEGTGIR